MAAHLLFGLRRQLEQSKIEVFQASASTCSPIAFGPETEWCLQFNRLVENVILHRSAPALIVLASKWNREFQLLGEEKFARILDEQLKKFVGREFKVLIVGPGLNFNVDPETVRAAWSTAPLDRPAQTFQKLNFILSEAAAKFHFGFVDPTHVFCRGDVCRLSEERHLLFWDYGHMTAEGSARLGKAVSEAINLELSNP